MGFNSVIFVRNDDLHTIERNLTGWWDEAARVMSGGHCREPVPIRGGYVVTVDHADTLNIIMSGQNYANVIHQGIGSRGHREKEDILHYLREYVDSIGYKIVKKPGPARRY